MIAGVRGKEREQQRRRKDNAKRGRKREREGNMLETWHDEHYGRGNLEQSVDWMSSWKKVKSEEILHFDYDLSVTKTKFSDSIRSTNSLSLVNHEVERSINIFSLYFNPYRPPKAWIILLRISSLFEVMIIIPYALFWMCNASPRCVQVQAKTRGGYEPSKKRFSWK